MPTMTIKEIAAGNPDFSILVAALGYLDGELGTALVADLDNPDTELTVFAPTNAAFGDLAVQLGYGGDPGDAAAVTGFLVANVDPGTLLGIVTYHVSPGAQFSGDVAGADTIATLNGATIRPDLPTLADNEPDALDPTLISIDNAASNGVVHVIDKVLLPEDLDAIMAPTITEIVASSGGVFDSDGGDFDILLAAVQAAGLADTLNSDGIDVTVFAPTDAAFIELAQTLGYDGIGEEGAWTYLAGALTLLGGGDPVPLLTEILKYHVGTESLQASQVLTSDEITALQGGTIGVDGITLTDKEPDVQDPQIAAVDLQASNGVVHAIDGVLLPADLLPSDGSNDVDFIIGDDRRSTVFTGADSDLVSGLGGNDKIFAGAGNDIVLGGDGRDKLFGGSGNDMLSGGTGKDHIFGGWGDDTIDGGAGRDKLIGGWGADTFVFAAGSGKDKIIGFESGRDKIDLSAYEFTGYEEIAAQIDKGFFRTEIDLGDGDRIHILGGRVEADDFIF